MNDPAYEKLSCALASQNCFNIKGLFPVYCILTNYIRFFKISDMQKNITANNFVITPSKLFMRFRMCVFIWLLKRWTP